MGKVSSLLAAPAHARCRLCREKEQQAEGNPHLPKRMGRPLKAAASPPKRARQTGANPEAEAEEPKEGLSGGVSKSGLDIASCCYDSTHSAASESPQSKGLPSIARRPAVC